MSLFKTEGTGKHCDIMYAPRVDDHGPKVADHTDQYPDMYSGTAVHNLDDRGKPPPAASKRPTAAGDHYATAYSSHLPEDCKKNCNSSGDQQFVHEGGYPGGPAGVVDCSSSSSSSNAGMVVPPPGVDCGLFAPCHPPGDHGDILSAFTTRDRPGPHPVRAVPVYCTDKDRVGMAGYIMDKDRGLAGYVTDKDRGIPGYVTDKDRGIHGYVTDKDRGIPGYVTDKDRGGLPGYLAERDRPMPGGYMTEKDRSLGVFCTEKDRGLVGYHCTADSENRMSGFCTEMEPRESGVARGVVVPDYETDRRAAGDLSMEGGDSGVADYGATDREVTTHHGSSVSSSSSSSTSRRAPFIQCLKCKEKIRERHMVLLNDGRFLHERCLRCEVCLLTIHLTDDKGSVLLRDNKVYCRKDYNQLFSSEPRREMPCCIKCNVQLEKDNWVRRADNYLFHMTCFCCSKCSRQLSKWEQFVMREERLICEKHFYENDGSQKGDSPKPRAKRMRTSFTEEQVKVLQQHFAIDSNPDGQDLERIAKLTGLKKRVTQVWFQNNRARHKKSLQQNSGGQGVNNALPSFSPPMTASAVYVSTSEEGDSIHGNDLGTFTSDVDHGDDAGGSSDFTSQSFWSHMDS